MERREGRPRSSSAASIVRAGAGFPLAPEDPKGRSLAPAQTIRQRARNKSCPPLPRQRGNERRHSRLPGLFRQGEKVLLLPPPPPPRPADKSGGELRRRADGGCSRRGFACTAAGRAQGRQKWLCGRSRRRSSSSSSPGSHHLGHRVRTASRGSSAPTTGEPRPFLAAASICPRRPEKRALLFPNLGWTGHKRQGGRRGSARKTSRGRRRLPPAPGGERVQLSATFRNRPLVRGCSSP